MKCITCTNCGLRNRGPKDVQHKLTNKHLAASKECYRQQKN